MPASATPPLRDYQAKGVAWVWDRLRTHKAVLLADDMGLGKTRQALSAARQLGARRILIVCPAGARRVWQQEIVRWFPGWSRRLVLIEPGTDTWRTRHADADLVMVVGYDTLSDLKSPVTPRLCLAWDLLVLDEAHYLKNPSNRTRAVYGRRGAGEGLQAHARKVLLLTGTPTPNHAGELWQHYRTLWPESLRVGGRSLRQDEFEDRFCRYRDTAFGRQVVGSKNQKILRQALGPVILRRRKDDVLPELPPLILQDIPLDTPKDGLRFRPGPEAARLSFSADTDAALLKALRNPDAAIATVRQELGLAKLAPSIAWVRERMLSVDKLLIFAWHLNVIEGLRRGLAEFDPETVTGGSSPGARALAVSQFQTNPASRVFIGQILAAGTAVTLTAASEVAIVEPSWVPGENVQAIARAHRLGQRDSVVASFLYLPGTLDQRIMQVFRRKAAEINVLLGDHNASTVQPDVRSGDRRRA